jgi:hypothetical protein
MLLIPMCALSGAEPSAISKSAPASAPIVPWPVVSANRRPVNRVSAFVYVSRVRTAAIRPSFVSTANAWLFR